LPEDTNYATILSMINLIAIILPWTQIFLSIALIALILFQQNEAGLGAAFGSDSAGGVSHKKRGLEKTLFNATIVIALLFVVTAILNLFV